RAPPVAHGGGEADGGAGGGVLLAGVVGLHDRGVVAGQALGGLGREPGHQGHAAAEVGRGEHGDLLGGGGDLGALDVVEAGGAGHEGDLGARAGGGVVDGRLGDG